MPPSFTRGIFTITLEIDGHNPWREARGLQTGMRTSSSREYTLPTIPVTRSCGRYGRLRTTYRARRWKYSRRDQFVSIPRFDEWNFVAVAERCEGPAGGTVAKSICSTSIAMIQSKSSDGTNNHFNWLRLASTAATVHPSCVYD